MQASVLLLITSFVGLITVLLLVRWREGGKQDVPTSATPAYKIRDSLLSPQKLNLYMVLREVFAKQAFVFPKVRVAEFFEHPGYQRNMREHWLRLQRRSVDFLVCDVDLTPILAVKVDPVLGRRHKELRDDVLEDSLNVVELPLLRLKLSDQYQLEDISNKIKFALARHDVNPGMHQSGSVMPDEDMDESSESYFPKFRRWTSDLWMAARVRRVH